MRSREYINTKFRFGTKISSGSLSVRPSLYECTRCEFEPLHHRFFVCLFFFFFFFSRLCSSDEFFFLCFSCIVLLLFFYVWVACLLFLRYICTGYRPKIEHILDPHGLYSPVADLAYIIVFCFFYFQVFFFFSRSKTLCPSLDVFFFSLAILCFTDWVLKRLLFVVLLLLCCGAASAAACCCLIYTHMRVVRYAVLLLLAAVTLRVFAV